MSQQDTTAPLLHELQGYLSSPHTSSSQGRLDSFKGHSLERMQTGRKVGFVEWVFSSSKWEDLKWELSKQQSWKPFVKASERTSRSWIQTCSLTWANTQCRYHAIYPQLCWWTNDYRNDEQDCPGLVHRISAQVSHRQLFPMNGKIFDTCHLFFKHSQESLRDSHSDSQ